MATPDHKARARASITQDDHLTTFPYTAEPTHGASLTNRLGDNHLAHRDRGVPLRATTRIPQRDGRPPASPTLSPQPRARCASHAV